MEIIRPNDWQEKSKSLNQDNIAKKVKEKAEAVCKNRKELADNLGVVLSKVEEQKIRVDTIVTNILNVLDKLDLEEKEAIRECCKNLRSKYIDYENDISVLQKRFQNKKIRVISFGKKSQGKSSLTKAYTGLPDSVVAVKGDTDEDKTGATNIIIHKKGVPADNPEIYVVFKKRERILEGVNKCINALSECGGIEKFSKWEDLYAILCDDNQKHNMYDKIARLQQPHGKAIQGFLYLQKMLQNVFGEYSDFSDVDKELKSEYFTDGKKISLEELPMYNDMQFKGKQKYMTVSEIRIYVDLEHNDMFENIEICDTKGISLLAGGDMWKADLYKEIGNSDAIFSVQMLGQKGGYADQFYSDLNDQRKDYPRDLDCLNLKHYALLNICTGSSSNDVDSVLDAIKNADIYNTIYAGALLENAKFDGKPLDMNQFVNYVIYDMMNKVVVSTQKTDNRLMKKINCYPEEIRKLREDLQSSLSCVNDFETKDWDAYIKELIVKKIPEVVKDLNEIAKKSGVVYKGSDGGNNEKSNENVEVKRSSGWGTKNSSSENNTQQDAVETHAQEDLSDNERKDNSQKEPSEVYKMITQDEGSKKYENVEKAIDEAIIKVCDDVYNDYVKENPDAGAACNIGAFIDDVSLKVASKISDNINEFVKISVNGEIDKFRNELFCKIWKAFGLNNFYPEGNDFKAEWLEDKRSELIKKWHTQYNDIIGLSGAEAIFPRLSYSILRLYFKDAEPLEEERNRNFEKVVVKERLEEAFVVAYKYHKFKERYRQCTKSNAGKRSVHSAVTAGFIDRDDFSAKLLNLYKLLAPNDYVKKLCKSDLINEDKKNEFENQKLKKELKETYSNLISLSF